MLCTEPKGVRCTCSCAIQPKAAYAIDITIFQPRSLCSGSSHGQGGLPGDTYLPSRGGRASEILWRHLIGKSLVFASVWRRIGSFLPWSQCTDICRLPGYQWRPPCRFVFLRQSLWLRPSGRHFGGHQCHFNLGGGKPLVHTASVYQPGADGVADNTDYWPEPSSLSPGGTDIRHQAFPRLPNLCKFSQPQAPYPPYL